MFSSYEPPEGFRYICLAGDVSPESAVLERGEGWIAVSGDDKNPENEIRFSISVKPSCPPEEARSLAVIAARFAADAIGAKTVIHWPNRVMLGEKCVCSLHCRAWSEVMVFSFSLDYHWLAEQPDGEIRKDLGTILTDIAAALARAAAACPEGLPDLMQSYCEKCAMLMKFVDVTYRGMPLYGFAFAVDKYGGLMVMTQESHTVVTVYSGEAKLASREPETPEMPPSPHI